jgi:hypothetical protein
MESCSGIASKLGIGCILNANVMLVGINESIIVRHFLGQCIASLVRMHAGIVEAEVVFVGIGPEL